MKLRERSYPHPVVGNKDDVPGASFQVTVEVTTDPQSVMISFTILNSSETLLQLISAGSAYYAAHVECSATSFRKLYEFDQTDTTISIPSDDLKGNVEVNCFVVAAKHLSNYTVAGQHNDYGNFKFEIRPFDILARSDGFQFPIDHNYSGFEKISSILVVVASPDAADKPMFCDLNDDKIQVILSQTDFTAYQNLFHTPVARVLETSIVLPALMTALSSLQNDSSGEFRWQRILTAKMDQLGITNAEDPLVAAQRILELPIRRTLLSATTSLEEAGD
jgi:hypothetical protein